jgi:L-iditol 2-dehydrogenase
MKAAVLTGIRQMEVQDVPDPVIKKDTDVLLKVEQVGVCGSDVHYYETGRIGSQIVTFPFILGHECAATVAKVGKGVKRVKAGQRVVVEPAVSCHGCEQCKAGRENTCYKIRFLGTPGQGGGCLCEYIVMPEDCCFPMIDTMTFEQGALCEPLAIGVYAVKQAGVTKGASAAILGSGPIGLSCLLAAKAAGAGACYMTEKIPERVDMAGKHGAAWVGNPLKEDVVAGVLKQSPLGVDVVFESAGQQETVDQAIEMLKPGGRLMLIGILRDERASFSIDKARRKEITIFNVRRQNHCTQKAVDLIASGRVQADFMITHRFELAQVKEAFDLVAGYRDGAIKAMVAT